MQAQSSTARLRRSLMVLPADNQKMMEKAPTVGADGLIIDLEDAVDTTRKQAARDMVRDCFARLDYGRCERILMINSLDSEWGHADLEATVPARPDAYFVPKVTGPDVVLAVDCAITKLEQQHSLPVGGIKLIAVLEKPAGLLEAKEISRCTPRLSAIVCGSEDVAAAMGIPRTPDNRELAWAGGYVALCAAAAHIDAIHFPVINWKDAERLERESREASAVGYSGKIVIHPAQVPIVNKAFSPSPEQIARAAEVVKKFERLQSEGAAIITHGGEMMDAPMVQQCRNILSKARAAQLL